MYYVIQALEGIKNKHFVSYSVQKYKSSPKNNSVIFEFGEKPNIKRKWAAKDEIILLTQDRQFFLNFLKKLKSTEESYMKKIDEQEQKIEALFLELKDEMHTQFGTIKNDKNIPSLLKDSE